MLAFIKKLWHNSLTGSKGQHQKNLGLKNMTSYTDNMVAEMEAIGSFTFETAEEYAAKYALSTRSVISKAKSLGLEYTPKVVVKSATPKVRKADVVAEITQTLGLLDGELDSLANANAQTLGVLLKAVSR